MFDIESLYQATSIQDAIRALQADERAMIISGGSADPRVHAISNPIYTGPAPRPE